MVVQMAKAIGAKVVTTAGSKRKRNAVAIGGRLCSPAQPTRSGTEIERAFALGYSCFGETLREPDFDFAVANLAERGRMILMAGRDARPAFPVGPFYVKGCSLHGFAMFKASADEQRLAANDMNHWMSSGALKSQIDRVMPIAQTAEAHRLQEQSTVQKSGQLAGRSSCAVGRLVEERMVFTSSVTKWVARLWSTDEVVDSVSEVIAFRVIASFIVGYADE